MTAWWFGTFFIFPIILGIIIPTDELHDFSEGWLNHQADESRNPTLPDVFRM